MPHQPASDLANKTSGAERIESATTWLHTNSKLGILGEFAGGNNSIGDQSAVLRAVVGNPLRHHCDSCIRHHRRRTTSSLASPFRDLDSATAGISAREV